MPLSRSPLRAAILAVLVHLEVKPTSVAIHFVSTSEISKLHEEFFADPSPTDCISFPSDPEDPSHEPFLGEVFVCPAVALAYAKKHSIPPRQELLLYMIHGILHLLGFDDLEAKDRRLMREKEKICMNYLKGLPLWQHFS